MSKTPIAQIFNAQQLEEMDDGDFAEAVVDDLRCTGQWHGPFVAPQNIDRTAAVLEDRIVQIEQQLERYEADPSSSESWVMKARNFLTFLRSTLNRVERRMESLERNAATRLSKWKEFAHELCDIIAESDLDEELDDLQIPVGELTARQWVARRVEKDPSRAVAA